MDLKRLATSSAVAAALAFGATPVLAQHTKPNSEKHAQGQEHAAPRADGDHGDTNRGANRSAPRQDARPQENARPQAPPANPAPRQEFRAAPRDTRPAAAPRDTHPAAAPRTVDRHYDNRGGDNHGGDHRSYDSHDRRSYDSHRFWGPSVYVAPHYQRIVPYRVYTPRFYRPGFSLGFGIYFGQPYSYRYAYPYSPYGYTAIEQGTPYGGVTFGMTPGDADVYVDGDYVGVTGTFANGAAPLTLTAGLHRMELQAPGYSPMVFDVNVVAGQVIPYQGSMQPGY